MLPIKRLVSIKRHDKSSQATRRNRRQTRPGIESLEQRQVLSGASATMGDYGINAWEVASVNNQRDIMAQVFMNNRAITQPFKVASSLWDESQPAVSVTSNGVIAVAYTQHVGSSNYDIMTQTFTVVPGFAGFIVRPSNTLWLGGSRAEYDPSISLSPDGRTAVVAYTEQYSTSDTDIMATRVRVNPTSSPSIQVDRTIRVTSDTRSEFDSSVLVTNNGDFTVAYSYARTTSNTDIRARAVRGNKLQSVKIVASTSASEYSPFLSSISGTNATIFWTSGSQRFWRTQRV